MTAAPAAASAAFPVLYNQRKRLLYEECMGLRNLRVAPFHVAFGIEVEGPLEHALVEKAFNELVRRQDALRARFHAAEAGPARRAALAQVARKGAGGGELYRQSIAAEASLRVAFECLKDLPAGEIRSRIERTFQTQLTAPFDYATPPLLRVTMLQTGPSSHLLIAVLHHLICDVWSVGILRREFEALYAWAAGGVYPFAADVTCYKRIACDQAQAASDSRGARAVAFWQDTWERFGEAQLCYRDLPNRTPAWPQRSSRGGEVSLELSALTSQEMHAFARGRRASPAMLFSAALTVLLCRRTGRDRGAFWANFQDRGRRDTRDAIGWMINPHLVGFECPKHWTADELLASIRDRMFEAQSCQHVPLGLVAETLGRAFRSSDLRVLLDVIEEYGTGAIALPGDRLLATRAVRLPELRGEVGLSILVFLSKDHITLKAQFSPDRLPGELAMQILDDLRSIVTGMMLAPAQAPR